MLIRKRQARRVRACLLGLLCLVLLSPLTAAAAPAAVEWRDTHTSVATSRSKALRPYTYTTPSSATSYDVVAVDPTGKERTVGIVKVDGVALSDVSARLSTDMHYAAVRVVGDGKGGSALYLLDVEKRRLVPIDSTKRSTEGFGPYAWSPAGNTMAYVRTSTAIERATVEEAYGALYLFSVGFTPMKLEGSNGNDRLLGFSGDGLGVYAARREAWGGGYLEHLVYVPISGGEPVVLMRSDATLRYSQFAVWSPPGKPAKVTCLAEGVFVVGPPDPTVTPSAPVTSTATLTPTIAAPTPTPTMVSSPTAIGVSSGVLAPIDNGDTGADLSGILQPDSADGKREQAQVEIQAEIEVPLNRPVMTTRNINLGRPSGFGLVASDAAGTWPTLLRSDAQAYPYITWSPDGERLLMGGDRTGNTWVVSMSGEKHSINTSLHGLRALTWSDDGTWVVLSDLAYSRLITLDVQTGKAVAVRDVRKYVKETTRAGDEVVRLAVPYIHQVNDISPYGNGSWACGPTSVAMVLAYYGKLEPWTMYVDRQRDDAIYSVPSTLRHTTPRPVTGADYAPYVTSKYTNSNGYTYNSRSADPSGKMLSGLYGTICPYGLAEWGTMGMVISQHGLGSQYLSVTWESLVEALNRGHPIIVGTQLTSEGHLLVAIGYTSDGRVIVNDPYGNRFEPGYGVNHGGGIYYPWKDLTTRRMLEVLGTYTPPPAYVPPPAPLPFTPTPEVTETPIITDTETITPTETVTATATVSDGEATATATTFPPEAPWAPGISFPTELPTPGEPEPPAGPTPGGEPTNTSTPPAQTTPHETRLPAPVPTEVPTQAPAQMPTAQATVTAPPVATPISTPTTWVSIPPPTTPPTAAPPATPTQGDLPSEMPTPTLEGLPLP